MITLRISAKNYLPHVNYQQKVIEKVVKPTDFIHPNIEKEVLHANKKELKQMKKISKIIHTTSSTMLLTFLPTTVFAQPLDPTGTTGNLEILNPSKVMELGLKLALVAIAAATALAIICTVLAGMTKMVSKIAKGKMINSKAWTTDIIKGYAQVLVAIPTILLLYYISTILFGDFETLVNLF